MKLQRFANTARRTGWIVAPGDDPQTDPIVFPIRYLDAERTAWNLGREVTTTGVRLGWDDLTSRLAFRGFDRASFLAERALYLVDAQLRVWRLLDAQLDDRSAEVFFATQQTRQEWRDPTGAPYTTPDLSVQLVDHEGRPYVGPTYPWAEDVSGRYYTDPYGKPYYLIAG